MHETGMVRERYSPEERVGQDIKGRRENVRNGLNGEREERKGREGYCTQGNKGGVGWSGGYWYERGTIKED